MSANPGYQHSKAFADLKGIKEQIEGNLSTVQYLRILDASLYRAMEVIVTNTQYADQVMAKMLAWSVPNFRRKLSMADKGKLIPGMMSFLLDNDPASRCKRLRELKLDRGGLFYCIRSFLSFVETDYLPMTECSEELPKGVVGDAMAYCKSRMNDLDVAVGLAPKANLQQVYLETKYWYEHAERFKQQILEKYTRLCLVNAQRDYTGYFNHRRSLDDIVQTYLYMASRAIDKCDSGRGALTSHIQNWFMTGRTILNREQPTESLEESTHLDEDLAVEEADTENATYLQALIRHVDPKGLGRYLLGMDEDTKALSAVFPRYSLTLAML